jgi:aryl sulfotransferase
MTETTAPVWPVKTRDIHNHHMNSTVWDSFNFRDGDMVIASYGKSGTTWMQQIMAQLVFDGAEGLNVSHLSPWVDLRVMPPEASAGLEHLPHRRFIKTHLPVDALVFSPKAKYVYIGRDGRDLLWSLYNHHATANDMFYGAINGTPGLVGEPLDKPLDDIRDYFLRWLARDGYPFWSPWENVRSWWGVRNLPNVMLIHFNDLKADLPGSIRKLADFLGFAPGPEVFGRIVEHCTFDYMKAHAAEVTPLGGAMWNGGADSFIHKGTNGRWRDVLTADDVAAYERRALAELGPDCAAWLAGRTG